MTRGPKTVCKYYLVPRHTTLLPAAVRTDREHTAAVDGLETTHYSTIFVLLINNENLDRGQC